MTVEQQTGSLFGDLWHRYDDQQFRHSVELFERRWRDNGEPADFFVGKTCLDAGCGGGRFSIAMAKLGAARVVGVDVGEPGLADARARASQLGLDGIVAFQPASVLALPFPDASFDFVCCSGVLHHTPSVERGLREIHRVLRPGGSVYLLLYGAGGLYWPLNLVLRPFAAALGYAEIDRAIGAAGFTAAKRRTILDDLFVPILETYTRERVDTLLSSAGFAAVRRWQSARLDHESDPATMIAELEQREAVFRAGAASAPSPDVAALESHLGELCGRVVAAARAVAEQGDEARARETIIGTGHHRLIATKESA